MKVYYSITNKGFFTEGVNDIPGDAIHISDKLYEQLKQGLSENKTIILLDDKLQCVSDTQLEQRELVASERAWRDAELIRADIELAKVQDSDPKAVGSVAGWREYRKALRSWTEQEDFPNTEKRPEYNY